MDGMTPDDLNSGNYLSTLRNKAIANHFNMLGESMVPVLPAL